MGKKNSYYGSFASFNPLNTRGLELYLNRNNATVSSWLDQSPNAFDFVQVVGTKQPVISANSVDFDGVDDFQQKVIADPYIGDSSGIIFFSGYYDSAATNWLLTSSDASSNFNNFWLYVASGKIILSTNSASISSTSVISNGAYFYGYVKSTGTSYEINQNGVIESLTGTDGGDWFADASSRDQLAIGSIQRLAPAYGPTKLSGLLYSNASLTDDEIDDINNFFSDPTNFQ